MLLSGSSGVTQEQEVRSSKDGRGPCRANRPWDVWVCAEATNPTNRDLPCAREFKQSTMIWLLLTPDATMHPFSKYLLKDFSDRR